MTAQAKATKIMLIRHGEKPTGNTVGIDPDGQTDKSSLIVQGWQRAGALACLFAPTKGPLQHHQLATPDYLYAADPHSDANSDETSDEATDDATDDAASGGTTSGGGGDSNRPYQTILPLSKKMQKKIHHHLTKKQTKELVTEVTQRDGVVLIAWEHGQIPKIANRILGNDTTAPQSWPGERFDIVWVFDLASDGQYVFHQVPQLLLHGDLPTKIE